MLIPVLVILALVVIVAFFFPKLMYERGAGKPTPTPIEAHSKKCFGFKHAYQKGDGGMVEHYCLGIPHTIDVQIYEMSMNSELDAFSATYTLENRTLEIVDMYPLYQDTSWNVGKPDTYFDTETKVLYITLPMTKRKPTPKGIMVDLEMFFKRTVKVPEGTKKVLLGMEEVDITPLIKNWSEEVSVEYSDVVSEDKRPIGQIVMNEDGSLTIDLYADGGGQMQKVVSVDDKDYDMWITHVGGLVKGEQKLVPPFLQ